MTGRLGGRSRVSSRPPGRLAFRPVKGPAPAACYCGLGPQPAINSSSMTTSESWTGCFGVEDFRVEVDVNTWASANTDLRLYARDGGGGLYAFEIDPVSGGGLYLNSNYTLKVYVSGVPTTLGGPTLAAHPAAGNTLELSAVGTSIVASKNGSPMFSATDSSFTAGTTNHASVSGNAAGAFDIDIVFEDYCP